MLGFLRDAWTLAQFATLSSARSVRLEGSEFPDGHVLTADGATLAIEVTEALMPDRYRGREFLPGMPTMREDPGSEWDRRLDELPAALHRAIARKAGKRYALKPTLLIYLNISAYGHRDDEMLAAISEARRAWTASFPGIEVLWQGRLV